MSNPQITTVKPDTTDNDSFFDENLSKGLEFATAEEEPQNATGAKRGRPFKNDPKATANICRENFNASEELRREVNIFIAQTRRFESKKDFYLQCVVDGLKKYKDK